MARIDFIRTWRRLALFAGLALALPAAAWAQTGTVTGTVTDRSTLQPLNGVQISITGVQRGGVTDARGRFVITNVPAGQQTVEAVFIGYGTAEQTVTVQAGQTATVNFEMGVSAISLDEVIVTGTAGAVERRQLGATVASVDVSKVQQTVPVAGVGSVLQARIPGVRSMKLAATYLAWIDFAGTGLAPADVAARVAKKARIFASPGSQFGPGGETWLRFNFATPRPILEEALGRLEDAFADVRAGR